MALVAGTRLGPYEIADALGVGGMGEVYRSRDTRLGRDVALKVLPESFAADNDRLRRFEQEARAVAALSHPNILAIFDIGAEGTTHYIATELLQGATLREKVAGGALPARRAIDCAQQIAHGLAAAHEKGIVHRDLKPENLFLTRDGRIKILDFGLAKQDPLTMGQAAGSSLATAGVQTTPGMVMGTVGYMSPEQVKGKPADARSDIFAFGAVLYEMLSGRRAFQRDTSAETMTAILKDDPPELASNEHAVAPAFERIVRRCLEKDAEQRFQSAKDLAFALEAVTGSASTSVKATSVRGARQVSAWLAAAIMMVAVIATAAALLMFRPKPEPLFHYQRVSYARGRVFNARFAPDGETIVYTAAWEGKAKDIYTVRKEFPDSRPMGIPGAGTLLAVSSTNELAVLVRDKYLMHMEHLGTLATVPLGGGAPREITENVHAADYSPDGKALAIVRHLGGNEMLEFPIGTVLYKTTGWFTNPRISPDGKSIAFVEHPILGDDRGYVQLMDISSRKVTRLTPEFESLQPLAWMPDGKQILFAGTQESFNRHIISVTLDGKMQDVLTLPVGSNIFDIARDGRLLISTNPQTATVIVYSPDGKQRELPYLNSPEGPILTHDGTNVVFSDDSEVGGKYYSVMIRKVDGSPPARLGDGNAIGISYDGKWVLSNVYTEPAKLMLLPTGPGEPRELPRGNISHYQFAGFFPDGKRVIFTGDEPGKPSRCYVQDIAGGPARAITPEGYSVVFDPVAPDGKSFVARDAEGQLVLFSAEGGAPAQIPNTTETDWPVGWSTDTDHLFIYTVGEVDMPVYKLDVHTGTRTLIKRYAPLDPVGVVYASWIGSMTPDGRTFAFGPKNELNDLYIADKQKH
jgi:Tol biopolymer transport system component